MRALLLLAAALLSLAAAPAFAEAPTDLTPEEQKLVALAQSLKPIRGVVSLPEAKAKLDLGEAYYFLNAADAKRVLTEGWGNPPSASDDVLGMVFPAGKTFLDQTWGAVIRYEATAYVSDKDAQSADYEALLKELRSDEDQVNKNRQEAGYPSVHVVGWAQPPSYDAKRNDLIWAQEIQFGAEEDHTLNYDIRHLGRHGVLSMNMISQMSKLADVRQSAIDLGRTAEFDAGARYADYQEGDKTAEYGLAGLVAAGLGVGAAKKVGLLAAGALFLKKGIGLVAVALAGIGAWVRKFLKRKDV